MFKIIEQLSNAVQNISTITSGLSSFYKEHPVGVCILLASIAFIGALYVEKNFSVTDIFNQNVQAEEIVVFDKLSHEEVSAIIASRIEDKNFLSIVANDHGLYRLEKMARFLDSKYRGQELTNETFEETNVLAFEEMVNKHNLYYNPESLSTADSAPSQNNNFSETHNELLEETTSKIDSKRFAVEFVSNNAFSSKTAASCTSSNIYERAVELENTSNLENNVQLYVVNPIECDKKNERFSCGSFLGNIEKIQVTFETAAKLFPDKYKPNVYNTLRKCELVHARIVY